MRQHENRTEPEVQEVTNAVLVFFFFFLMISERKMLHVSVEDSPILIV